MRISKTRFINYMRCDRYAALDEIRREREKAVVGHSDDPELEELFSEENRAKTMTLLDAMIDEEGTDLIAHRDEQVETMLPYYRRIEMLAGQAIKNRFKGEVIYSLDTYRQKRFEFEHEGYRFYCFLDGYQEDEDEVRIFEVKATTGKKFLDMTFRDGNKRKRSIFSYSPEGILMPREDLGEPVNDDYLKKRSKLESRFDRVGRYVYDLAYQRYVHEHADGTEKRTRYYLVVLNSEYVQDGRTDAHGDPIYDDSLVTFIDLSSVTESLMPRIGQDIEALVERLGALSSRPVDLGPHCQRNDVRQCAFYPICYAEIPEDNSLFVYLHGHHGFRDENGERHERFDLINHGYTHALDIPKSWLQREDNIIQREAIESGQPFYKKEKIKAGIESLKYPLYHLDFETFPCPLPRFYGEKPYSQSLFQYSIHIEREPGVCDFNSDNYGYIATEHRDLRRELIESMLDVIKEDGGSVIVYNQSFEKSRLKEMADLFPEYRERLLDLSERLFDLMHLMRGNKKFYQALGYDADTAKGINFYHPDLNGSYSIKRVLPIFSDLSYQGLNVANGTEALATYARFPKMSEEMKRQSYNDLLEYCKQDTWAMVLILSELRKLA
ncbi:MAG: DUF2779 domain-containing protein [Acholeplasmataceae bacterium]